MSTHSIATGSPNYETPHAPFPPDPEIITIGGHDVFEYLEPRQVDRIIHNIADQINFADFDAVVVNMSGGKFLYERLKQEKGYEGGCVEVEYHRPKDGIGTEITIPVPPGLAGKKCLLIDDISDRGDTFMAILNGLSPESVSVALISKKDIPDKKDVPNLLIGVTIEGYVWIAGCGMDIGYDDEGETFRNHPGIVVKIPKGIESGNRWIY